MGLCFASNCRGTRSTLWTVKSKSDSLNNLLREAVTCSLSYGRPFFLSRSTCNVECNAWTPASVLLNANGRNDSLNFFMVLGRCPVFTCLKCVVLQDWQVSVTSMQFPAHLQQKCCPLRFLFSHFWRMFCKCKVLINIPGIHRAGYCWNHSLKFGADVRKVHQISIHTVCGGGRADFRLGFLYRLMFVYKVSRSLSWTAQSTIFIFI